MIAYKNTQAWALATRFEALDCSMPMGMRLSIAGD